MWRQVGWLARQAGVTRITVGNWIRAGRYEKVERTRGGHYRVWVDEVRLQLGYVRVASHRESPSVKDQRKAIEAKNPGIEVLEETGSGLDFKRHRFRSLLERCLQETPIQVVVTSRDRLTESGFPFLKWIVERNGGSIVELEEGSPEQDITTEELVRFITCCLEGREERSDRRKKGQTVPGEPKAV